MYEITEEEFNAAIDIAIDKGDIANKEEVSFKKSGHWGLNFVLKDENGKILTRIEEKVVEIKVDPSLEDQFPSLYKEKEDFKEKEENSREKAVAWAKSMGYPIPTKMGGCLSTFLIVLGFLAAVIPGLILLFHVWNNGNQYERDMKALVEKWIDAGKPEPGVKAKLVGKLEKVEEIPATSPSTESRLEELQSMKEKGLISQEEYDTLRKKALGL